MTPLDPPTPDSVVAGYDAVAERYADEMDDELDHKPLDRALYGVFAELVGPGAVVGDVGCGPGQVTAHLAELGLRPVGIDPSPGMIDVARRRRPSLEFRLGPFAELGTSDGEWAGAVAPFSIIHVPPAQRPEALAALAGAIASGGWLLVAFHVSMPDQAPGSVRHMTDWWDTDVDIDFHFIDPDDLVAGLADAGFATMIRTEREPWPGIEAPSRRCYLIAQRH